MFSLREVNREDPPLCVSLGGLTGVGVHPHPHPSPRIDVRGKLSPTTGEGISHPHPSHHIGVRGKLSPANGKGGQTLLSAFLRRSTMYVTTVEVMRLRRPPMRMSMGTRTVGQVLSMRKIGTM